MGAFQDFLQRGGTIDYRVDYYDEDHAKLLATYPEAATIHALAGTTLSVPAAEFLTYCLFVNMRPGNSGVGSYRELRAALDEWMGGFNRGLILTPRSIATRFIGNEQIDQLTEKVGVAAALTLANRIHGLNEADWRPIPTSDVKTLDFDYAANLTGYVQIEAKGAAVDDNTRHRRFGDKADDIAAKKTEWRAKPGKGPASLYGTIAVLDQRPDSVLQCWLLDPPAQPPHRAPRHQRILNRLRFAAEIFEVLIPKSNFVSQLYQRIGEIAEAEDLAGFDGRPLGQRDASWEQNIVAAHDHTADQKAFGVVFDLSDGSHFFYGLRREWLSVVQEQRFDQLLALEWEPATETTAVSLRSLLIDKWGEAAAAAAAAVAAKKDDDGEKRSRRRTIYPAALNTTSSGRVFGLIGPIQRETTHVVRDE